MSSNDIHYNLVIYVVESFQWINVWEYWIGIPMAAYFINQYFIIDGS